MLGGSSPKQQTNKNGAISLIDGVVHKIKARHEKPKSDGALMSITGQRDGMSHTCCHKTEQTKSPTGKRRPAENTQNTLTPKSCRAV